MSNLSNTKIYHKGKAFSELLTLVLLSIVLNMGATLIVGMMESILSTLTGLKIITGLQLFISVVMLYRIYFWLKKSESSRVMFYMFPLVTTFILTLPDYYFGLFDIFGAITFALSYSWVALLKGVFGLYSFVIYVVGYRSLKAEMSNNNIAINFLGPDKDQLEQFNPQTS